MKKTFNYLRDTFIAGIIFLLPMLVLAVLISKVFQFISGFTSKIAKIFGLNSILGVSGGTIVSGVSFIVICFLLGYLMRISFFKRINRWMNKKLSENIPGYAFYRDKALSTIDPKEEVLPYKNAALINSDNIQQPCFVIENMSDGKSVVFVPTGGNAKEGTVLLLPTSQLHVCQNAEMKAFQMAINNRGIGLDTALAN